MNEREVRILTKSEIKKHNLKEVAKYDAHKSGHTKKFDVIVDKYRADGWHEQPWCDDEPTCYMLYVGKHLSNLRWGADELPYAKTREMEE